MTGAISRVVVKGSLLAFLLTAASGLGAHGAAALEHGRGHGSQRTADAPPAAGHRSAVARRAPSSPPLTAAGAGGAAAEEGPSPQAETDPLVSNGLGSPLCTGSLGAGRLPAESRRHCETSGFVAAAAPTGDYAIDVHIDTGVLGLSSGGLLSTVQDLFVTPVWLALVWAVHAVVVMLEWCFTVDLLDSAAAGSIGRGLRQMQTALTDPWLAVVLAVASVLAVYNGLIRRRVAETVGQALLMTAMMVGGTWVILDPIGTVGALGRWANQASIGTLAVAAQGTPVSAGGVLARSMGTVFAVAIEAPWCYLEFGDVGWCRDPGRLDQRLHTAGLRIAAGEVSLISCKPGSSPLVVCVGSGGPQARALEHSVELLREARSNGAVFLALPANGSARNSINESGSLLRTMCQSSDATRCRGPTAAQAEFRTNGGTWSRVGGLLLIVVGVLGMMLLLGFLAMRLLAAAVFSLLYLLLAPGMVLTPALGESGRAVFRRWAAHLLGAVVSKLLFSFLLGIVLAVVSILSNLQSLGWWTQWLLMSAFWWGAYLRRHQALGVAEGALGREPRPGHESLTRRVSERLEAPRRTFDAVRSTMKRQRRPASELVEGETSARGRHPRPRAGTDEQARRTLQVDQRDSRARLREAPALRKELSAKRSQLDRVRRERVKALAGGDTRRAAELDQRARRVEGHVMRKQRELIEARELSAAGRQTLRRTGSVHTPRQLQERERFLDQQAALPPAVAATGRRRTDRGPRGRRNYPALAGLAGYGRAEYEALAPGRRRDVRLEIDRELARRLERSDTTAGVTASKASPSLGRRAIETENAYPGSSPRERRQGAGLRVPASRDEGPDPGPPRVPRRPESSVMRDAREVAARRKRQLGTDRP
jgi:hypothetical protein